MNVIILFFCSTLLWANLPTKHEQFQRSLDIVIENSTRPDVMKGMVVASPSKISPNYYYDWVRDTALTMRSLIDYFEKTKDSKIREMIFNWVQAEIYRQNIPTLTGLGEPKFNVDGSGFSGPWGRPQNDGPALRALSLIKFARILLKEGDQDYVLQFLYHGVLPADSVIKKDLEYVAHHWNEQSFDLWEEEKGLHFYTLMAQHVALQEGALLAKELGDLGAARFYDQESRLIGHFVKSNFNDSIIGLKVSIHRSAVLGYKNSLIDIAPLLALLHTSPYQKLYHLDDEFILKYLDTLKREFSSIYPINKTKSVRGLGLGRYPEDRYDGYETSGEGNPWFLSTIALAEYYCLMVDETKNKRSYALKKLHEDIEAQFERVIYHSDKQGHLSEQFNKTNGFMQGALNLTWSHNSFMTAYMRCGFLN